jgi:hypothetical protein
MVSAKGQTRLSEVSSKEPSEERVSPLFARNDPPIPADHIAEIKLQRIVGKDRHVDLPMSDFYLDGDPEELFVISPYTVNEQELQAQFGGGEYWIEARRKPDGALWKGSGRRLVLGGAPKGSGDPDENEEEYEQEHVEPTPVPVTPPPAPPPPVDLNQHKVYELLDRQSQMAKEHADLQVRLAQERADRETEMARERATRDTALAQDYADRKVAMHNDFATTMLQMAQGSNNKDPNASQEVVRVLREENDSLRARLRQDTDDTRRAHREDLDKRERQHEDTLRADRQRADREIDDLRRRSQVQEDELRRRWTDDSAELRSRHERDMTQARGELLALRTQLQGEMLELRTKLQGELDRARQDYEKRIRDLERENIELEKKANSVQAELDAVQNAPPGGPTITDRIMAMAQTDVGQALLGQALRTTMAGAPPAQPTPSAFPPVAPPQGITVPSAPGISTTGPVDPTQSVASLNGRAPDLYTYTQSNVIPFTPSAAVPAPWMPPAQPATVPVTPVESQPVAMETQPHVPTVEASGPTAENTMPARGSFMNGATHTTEPSESIPPAATPA